VLSALEGYNGTIFAYGQTGSGKTYTMMGSDGAELDALIQEKETRRARTPRRKEVKPYIIKSKGIIALALEDLF
jgi:hypothetical protein